MSAIDALNELDFGSVNSESEEDLDRLFVRTRDFDKFLQPKVWLALGAKGTGKSALFELFTKYESSARALSGDLLDDVIIAAGTGFGDLSEVATGDLQHLKDSQQNYDHTRLWKLYIAVKSALAIDSSTKLPPGPLRDLLQGLHERRDLRIGSLLSQLWSLTVGAPLSSLRVSTGGATIELTGSKHGTLDVVSLLSDINKVLEGQKKDLWLLFDKIDEIWPADRVERTRALEGLMTAAMEIRRTFPRIQPRVMLRTDLWAELDFTNKDHLTDKRIELNWGSSQLTTLLLKRAVRIDAVMKYVKEAMPELTSAIVDDWTADQREAAFVKILPDTAYPGEREAAIASWLAERVQDGRKTVLPRDAIVLGNEAADYQRDRGETAAESLT